MRYVSVVTMTTFSPSDSAMRDAILASVVVLPTPLGPRNAKARAPSPGTIGPARTSCSAISSRVMPWASASQSRRSTFFSPSLSSTPRRRLRAMSGRTPRSTSVVYSGPSIRPASCSCDDSMMSVLKSSKPGRIASSVMRLSSNTMRRSATMSSRKGSMLFSQGGGTATSSVRRGASSGGAAGLAALLSRGATAVTSTMPAAGSSVRVATMSASAPITRLVSRSASVMLLARNCLVCMFIT